MVTGRYGNRQVPPTCSSVRGRGGGGGVLGVRHIRVLGVHLHVRIRCQHKVNGSVTGTVNKKYKKQEN
jgi:hypothetical protein